MGEWLSLMRLLETVFVMGHMQDCWIWEANQQRNFSVQSFCQTLMTRGEVPSMHQKV